MKKTYSRVKEIVSFWKWLYHEYDEPAEIQEDTSGKWFIYCGSSYRRHYLRLFGIDTYKSIIPKLTGMSGGKYLFFGKDRNDLISVAHIIVQNDNISICKVSRKDRNGSYVLCVYDTKPKLLEHMKRYATQEIQYRYWKSNKQTVEEHSLQSHNINFEIIQAHADTLRNIKREKDEAWMWGNENEMNDEEKLNYLNKLTDDLRSKHE